jgi:D-beta-D-heptose 7-phosphate kinase/D-beta-D-heptose 1-phosphate adenosyltransferase
MLPPRVTPEESRGWLSRLSERRIVVVGDVMLDEYVWGEAARISPEAPVPILEVIRESLRLGGAANVAKNIASLGGTVELLSVVGADSRADDLRRMLEEDHGIDGGGLFEDPARPTTLKTRIVASRQQVVRVDRESREALSGELRERFLDRVLSRVAAADGVIVSDYGKGVVDLEFMEELGKVAHAHGTFVAVDPKDSHFHQYRHVSVVTPNTHEASGAAQIAIKDAASLEAAGRKLLGQLQSEGVLITRGSEGMSLFRPDIETTHIPVMAREVYDVTGAGDTVIATFTAARVAGATLEQAAVLSNAAAAVVVGEIGTASVTPEELFMAVEAGFPKEPKV